ncbi:MAG: ATP-grasp domain-containing protein, partial [Chloroflexi bacterium]|nr:ATP-grasp domain-containing protein [Chloroflexota bacterium]
MTEDDVQNKHIRILLLMSPATYRAGAFLSAAQQLNLEVVVGIDLPETLADYWHVPLGVDFLDIEKSLQTIIAFAQQQPLRAILSVDDRATELAARASAALGLAHNSPQAAEAARDKRLMRRLMSAGGAPCPVFRPFLLSENPAWVAEQVSYPCVVKPLRLSGSRGVIRADTPTQFVAAFERLKRLLLSEGYVEHETSILVEDFIPGFEVALEGLLTSGQLKVLTLFDKPDPLDGPFFEETIYTTPSRLAMSTQQEIARSVALAAASLGLREGPVHAELRVNEQGPWMLEIAGRSIGGLCSTILQFGSGMCLEELILRHAIGEQITSIER